MTTSKKPVVGGVRFRTPLLLLLMVLVVTCFARARPTEVKASRVHYNSANFNAYCWDTIDDFKELIEDKRDTNGIAYKSYNPKFHYKNHNLYLKGKEDPIDLRKRCDGTINVNVNIKMYKKWKIKMYILSVNLPLNSTQKVVSYL